MAGLAATGVAAGVLRRGRSGGGLTRSRRMMEDKGQHAEDCQRGRQRGNDGSPTRSFPGRPTPCACASEWVVAFASPELFDSDRLFRR